MVRYINPPCSLARLCCGGVLFAPRRSLRACSFGATPPPPLPFFLWTPFDVQLATCLLAAFATRGTHHGLPCWVSGWCLLGAGNVYCLRVSTMSARVEVYTR